MLDVRRHLILDGDKLTYMLAINGNYLAGSRAALIDAGKSGTDAP